jgi:putative transposase
MALGQSALLEVLDALKVADVGDRVRQAAETIYQALIEAELTCRCRSNDTTTLTLSMI